MPDTLLFASTAVVKPEWIDYNGHMNMGYYLVAIAHIHVTVVVDPLRFYYCSTGE